MNTDWARLDPVLHPAEVFVFKGETTMDDKPAKTAEDIEQEAHRENVKVVTPDVAQQHEQVDAAAAKRNEENEEGHVKNLEKIESEAQEAQARTAHADDHRANHTPTGKEQNRNTPRVLADGTKVWD